MATPLRPIMLTFRVGKGLIKSRRESQDPSRAVAEQVAIRFAEDSFGDARKTVENQITRDVRSELIHIMKLFRKYILGRGDSLPKPTGTLTTVTKGSYMPTEALGIPKWAPRGATYLKHKRWNGYARGWFAYKGTLGRIMAPKRDQWGAGTTGSGGGGVFSTGNAGNETLFEDLFGPVSVTLQRNKSNWGVNASATLATSKSTKVRLEIGTIRVRALGQLTDEMLQMDGQYNSSLMELVKRTDPLLSYRLGNRWKYRPSLEPFLAFFLRRSIGHAVTERLRSGLVGRTILR